MSQTRLAGRVHPRAGSKPAFGEHVGIRPVAGTNVGVPLGEHVEVAFEAEGISIGSGVCESPCIPVVVGDAPHLRVFGDFGGVLELGWAGREREHDGAAGFANGFGDLADFSRAVGMVGDAIDFEEVEAPVSVEANHRVVVGLARGVVFDAPVALVPRAGGCGVSGIDGMKPAAGDGKVGGDDLAGNAAHDVNAELEAPRVEPVGQRFESGAVCGVRKARGDRDEQAVSVPEIVSLFKRVTGGVGHVPAFIDDGVLPAVLLDGGEDGGVGLELIFVDGEAVGVPTVPAHGWCWRQGLSGDKRRDEKCGGEKSGRNEGWLGHEERYSTEQ